MSIYILIGFPASTKSSYAQKILNKCKKNGVILSRDAEGNAVSLSDLLPKAEDLLKNKKIVILDNTNLTKKVREPFIKLAESYKVSIYGIYFKTSIEDCQIRALDRMWNKYHEIFLTGKPDKSDKPDKKHDANTKNAAKDPNVFPPAVLFSARKQLEEPSLSEGFTKLKVIDVDYPKFDKRKFNKKALFLDIDGTLRTTNDDAYKYPVRPDQVHLLYDAVKMKEQLDSYIKKGYKLIGVSNQSGIAKKSVTDAAVKECFDKTRELLGYTEKEFEILYCPHNAVPIQCYCRKPQVGMPMYAIEKYHLNPQNCIMVGDMKTDETMANRLKIQFINVKGFWKISE